MKLEFVSLDQICPGYLQLVYNRSGLQLAVRHGQSWH